MDFFNNLFDKPKRAAEDYYQLGMTSYKRGDNEAAIAYLNESIELNPTSPSPYAGLGLVYSTMLNLKAAVENYSKAISLAPNWGEMYEARGRIYYFSKQLELAKADIEKSIELAPNFPLAYHMYGLITDVTHLRFICHLDKGFKPLVRVLHLRKVS